MRASEYHFGSRHHALLSWKKKPPSRVLVQHVDREYLEVKGDLVVEAKEDVEALAPQEVPEMAWSVSNGIQGFLHYWMECHAIICKLCAKGPILCRSIVISHVREQHIDEEAFQDLEAFEHRLNVVEPLAEPENCQIHSLAFSRFSSLRTLDTLVLRSLADGLATIWRRSKNMSQLLILKKFDRARGRK